ncbi:uncharacterized protein LOC115742078 isoform X2 [Rhodamnia argentea]|uniref:Uncharacterized protein LOC115742078 isoform X2 n=1 Tax=Rhodamnia argentea TaxID=178133 RepID=A0A8B8PB81_9MYRT|nr:uncharacterized protein LOC115742078 isoform X2 [Rhodamnia argentea]
MAANRRASVAAPGETAKPVADHDGDDPPCKNPSCFFCAMNEPDPSLRRARIAACFEQIPLGDDPQTVLVLSGLWNVAMAQPDNQEFPSLGLFDCLARLILRGVRDKEWLRRDQNVYIPYYAAHVVGSYVMNKARLAEKAMKSGVVPGLMELMRGKMSWVEQRVAVRALGHLASHDEAFEAMLESEQEIVGLAMEIASNCLEVVYDEFIGVKRGERERYHVDLVTRGIGGKQTEDARAEEWASQLQCWSLYLLNCFASKNRGLDLMCKRDFLRELCGMWGGLANRPSSSPGAIGLIRTLCRSDIGRSSIASSRQVIECLCNLSRSSDDCQYMAIDSLLLLLRDPDTRHRVLDMAAVALADLVELEGGRGEWKRVGERITRAMLQDYHKFKYGDLKLKSERSQRALEGTWDLKVERRRREKLMSEEEVRERKAMVGSLKREGNESFWCGEIKRAALLYTEALELCLLKWRKQRIVIHSNRAQCRLLTRDPDNAISDATRALCLSGVARPHGKSLWRRSQAYDMRGSGRESLMDCLTFVHVRMSGDRSDAPAKNKIPYYATRMLNKQMNATWLFARAASKKRTKAGMKKKKKKKKKATTKCGREDGATKFGVKLDRVDGMLATSENKSRRSRRKLQGGVRTKHRHQQKIGTQVNDLEVFT